MDAGLLRLIWRETLFYKSGKRVEAISHDHIILCSDGSLYTGITTDPERRFRQHAAGSGAKYFRGRKPMRIVYQKGLHTRSSAGCRELQIKGMTRGDKAALVDAAAFNDISYGAAPDPEGN